MMDGDHAGAEWKRFERLVTVLDSQTLPAANTKPYLAIVKRYESAINQLGLSSAKVCHWSVVTEEYHLLLLGTKSAGANHILASFQRDTG
jgi:hypothetical protein